VGGLLVSQALTLFTTPVVYLYLDRLSQWLSRELHSAKKAGDHVGKGRTGSNRNPSPWTKSATDGGVSGTIRSRRRNACPAVDTIRVGDQPQDCSCARLDQGGRRGV